MSSTAGGIAGPASSFFSGQLSDLVGQLRFLPKKKKKKKNLKKK
jgi:hypothetical protein